MIQLQTSLIYVKVKGKAENWNYIFLHWIFLLEFKKKNKQVTEDELK